MQQNVFAEYILWTTRNLQLDELELVPNVSMKMCLSKVVKYVQNYTIHPVVFMLKQKEAN